MLNSFVRNKSPEFVIYTVTFFNPTISYACIFQTIADYVNFIETELKACEEEECKLLYIRSIGNAGLVKLLPLLLDQARNSKSSTVSLTAIQGLRRMQISDFRDEVIYGLVLICTCITCTTIKSIKPPPMDYTEHWLLCVHFCYNTTFYR